jgi:anti-sigma factor RsiW
MHSLGCKRTGSILIEIARERNVNTAEKLAAMDHLAVCNECASSFSSQSELSTRLREMAQAYEERPSDVIEKRVIEEFRKGRRSGYWLRAAAAATVLLLLGFTTYLFSILSHQVEITSVKVPAPVPVATTGLQSEPAPVATPVRVTVKSRKRYVRRKVQSLYEEQQVTTNFLPLDPVSVGIPLENAQLIRVELPKTSLQLLGFPPMPDDSRKRVTADLLVGEDGLARAIRFVR